MHTHTKTRTAHLASRSVPPFLAMLLRDALTTSDRTSQYPLRTLSQCGLCARVPRLLFTCRSGGAEVETGVGSITLDAHMNRPAVAM